MGMYTMERLNAYIHYHEYDLNFERPTLVIQTRADSIGFEVNPETGAVGKEVCVCHALTNDECICGVLF